MDLYSSDYGAIQEGNMRSKAVTDRNNVVNQHNKDVGTQIANLKATQKGGEETQDMLQATQQFWAGSKVPNEISAVQDHLSKGGTLFSNPTSQAQSTAEGAVQDSATTTTDVSDLTDTGDGIFTSETADVAEEGLGSTALKGLGAITSVATGGYDIYKDVKSLEAGKGIAGDNWASKTSNLLQIGGAIADLGGTVFPPAALLGGVLDITAGVFGEVGAAKDESKQEDADTTLQQQQTETTQTQVQQAPVSTGRVS